jgi:methyltransferase of ATP-grasp peptide maturase system
MDEPLAYLTLSPDEADLVRARREAMVERMVRSGAITTPEWRGAFVAVPRHAFMPRFFARSRDGLLHPVDGTRPEQRRQWLESAYEMTSFTTQLDTLGFADAAARPAPGGEPTSSTTQPDVMAGMLDVLRLERGRRVMEIGTGTGYNAALLAERLGSDQVVSVEIDPGLADAARQRLTWCGYTPTVITGDGLRGHRTGGPYDRVIATAAVPAIPHAWLDQTRPGGLILANVSGILNAGGLALLTVHESRPHRAEGRFLAHPAAFFMPVRCQRVGAARRTELLKGAEAEVQGGAAPARPTPLTPDALDLPGFDFLASLVLRGTARLDVGTEDDQWITWLLAPHDRSAAAITPDRHGTATVSETGPRRLWTAVEHAHALWQHTGHPHRDRYGLTITPTRQHVWLDVPDGPHTWRLTGGKGSTCPDMP